MAKAVRGTGAPPRGPRGPVAPPATGTSVDRNYFRGVWEELRKVVWPTREELARMTGVVVATVIIFSFFIGGLDEVLAIGAQHLYKTGSSSASTQQQTTPATAPSSAPTSISLPSAQATSAPAGSLPASP